MSTEGRDESEQTMEDDDHDTNTLIANCKLQIVNLKFAIHTALTGGLDNSLSRC
jgi:hypothetical protein